MNVIQEQIYANVSAPVSAGDGVQFDVLLPQPPVLLTGNRGVSTAGVSAPMYNMLELIRRMFTHIDSPSATLASGGSAGSVQITFGGTALGSGIVGKLQGWPFVLSAAGALSAQPTSAISTASNQIRKVLVTLGMSALPVASSFALAGGTVQFVYGSAMTTSAGACTSGGQGASFFDLIPLPTPSANEIPVGWINVVNSFAASAGINASHMFTDWRVTQGINLSAMMAGLAQP